MSARVIQLRQCLRKKRFRTKISALVQASLSMRRSDCDSDHFRPYQCPICEGWHLTKQYA